MNWGAIIVQAWLELKPLKRLKARRKKKLRERKQLEESQLTKETVMLDNLFSWGALKSKLVWLGVAQILWGVAEAYLAGTLEPGAASKALAGIITILLRAVTDTSLADK